MHGSNNPKIRQEKGRRGNFTLLPGNILQLLDARSLSDAPRYPSGTPSSGTSIPGIY